ncbi:SDR family oxidoreductase [Actinophytocola oryzae]|uniref:NADP-dependent 3-hydroxy acid dehydrogenase YdfG n=1 Tax=Actinophytocola oryzae TaxID=502181 RepID=A0A4R7VYE5_9PSEU|nr:SDR family oxidoreductase [Actinophytocola oryzae]TDV55200.1 NADP-dependent 3-hydroxy acid dehydrogenase YdfG [Actinophytocola oryzae]
MRTAVVTGGGSGLGRAMAVRLATRYHVVVAGRTASSLDEVAAETGGTAVVTDVRSRESVTALFDVVRDRFGRLDLLVNNAGLFGRGGPIASVDAEDWQAVVDTNLNGAFWCAQAAFRLMSTQEPRGGRIINNGSISAHAPRPHAVAYTATKHAITGLTKALSLEGREFDIACGQIDIGNAATDMTAAMGSGVLQANGSTMPEPTMNADDVADMVLHMAELPLTANVQFMTVMATNMPYIGRG